ncbi:MAG: response regulator [Chloroflexi bacterium]|nr:MAG: response regulator [Chloroflexota bacterium]
MDQTTNNRIMIVGGDSHFSYLMQRFVRTSAHQVVMANLGDDVLSLARGKKPVAIVLEMDLPETAGWRTLRALKADPQVGKIPVIACSWLEEEARGLAEGASVYLRMPILHTDFAAALADILEKEKNE